jgi:hypothetical protein
MENEVLFLPDQTQDFRKVEALKGRQTVVILAPDWTGGVKETHAFMILALRIFQFSHHSICGPCYLDASSHPPWLPQKILYCQGINGFTIGGDVAAGD